ncbi:MAG: hypothetical protein KF795_24840 [Labilithrix sp.]|nr:hypothetical protein [Labilithrix sp.]
MSRLFGLGVSVSVLSFVVLAACVGDDPGAPALEPGTDGGADGSSPGATDEGGNGCAGDTIDACGASCTKCAAPEGGTAACVNGTCAKKCEATQTLCGDACVDTTGSRAHCGRCDHSCGAGECSASACQPFAVATGFTDVHGIAMSPSGVVISADSDVSLCAKPDGCSAATSLSTIVAGVIQLNDVTVAGTVVYFDGNDGDSEIVFRCPVAGCPGAGPDIIESTVNDTIGRVIAGPTDVLWTRYQSYYGQYSRRCSLPGCASSVAVRPIPTTGPYYDSPQRELTVPSRVVSVGATSTLWATGGIFNDSTKNLRACPLASSCPTPTEIDTAEFTVSALTYYDGKHYGASGATGGGNVIFSVSDAAPGTRALLVSDAAGIADVAVDASGIYWVNGTTGKVLRCKTLKGCMGAGETLAVGQTGARRIALDASFVYWSTPTAVMKVAK